MPETNSVVAAYDSRDQAAQAVTELRKGGIDGTSDEVARDVIHATSPSEVDFHKPQAVSSQASLCMFVKT